MNGTVAVRQPPGRAAYETARDAVKQFLADKAPRLGAALAFYTTLSLSPLLLVVIAIAGLVLDQAAAQARVVDQIRDLVGADGAKAVEAMLASASSPHGGALAIAVGVAVLVVGATGVFAQLQDALNTIWGVEPKTHSGFRAMLQDRLLSFAAVCGLAFLLLVSLVFSAALHTLSGVFGKEPTVFLQVLDVLVSYLLTTAMFAMIFKLLPAVRPAWSDVWAGAGVTGALFLLGKFLIGLYLGRAAVGSAYGAAGSFVVLLVWVYYSTQILLFGAELTRVFANRFGSGLGAARAGGEVQP